MSEFRQLTSWEAEELFDRLMLAVTRFGVVDRAVVS